MQENIVMNVVAATKNQMMKIWSLLRTIRSKKTATEHLPIPMAAKPATWLKTSHLTAVKYTAGSPTSANSLPRPYPVAI